MFKTKIKKIAAALGFGLILIAAPIVRAAEPLEALSEGDVIAVEPKTETEQISEIEEVLDLVKAEVAKLESQLEVMQLEETSEIPAPVLPEIEVGENQHFTANTEPLFQFPRRVEKQPRKIIAQNRAIQPAIQSADVLAAEAIPETIDFVAPKKPNQLLSVYSLIIFCALFVFGAISFVIRFTRQEKKLSAKIGQIRLLDSKKPQ